VIDVQRVGPSTGMPTRTQQGDMLECAYASHGDTKHILLFPANPAECFEFAVKSFDLAERFQTPVFMLSDLDIGMNDWVTPKLTWDDSLSSRPRPVLTAEADWKTHAEVPPLSAETAIRRGPHAARRPFQRRVLHARLRPQQVRRLHGNAGRVSGSDGPPAAEAQGSGGFVPRRNSTRPGARVGVITLGGCDPAVREALDILAEQGSRLDYMRIRGFPFDEEVEAFIAEHDFCFVVEQNRDAQLRAADCSKPASPKTNCVRADLRRFPLSAKHVLDAVQARRWRNFYAIYR
jgi:2-oxoglutarate ferredoxin oxidoreductase subunit alpha